MIAADVMMRAQKFGALRIQAIEQELEFIKFEWSHSDVVGIG